MCFESVHSELTIDKKNDLRQRVHELLGDISERFVDDAVTIIDKFDDQRFVNKVVSKKIVSSNSLHFNATMEYFTLISLIVSDLNA